MSGKTKASSSKNKSSSNVSGVIPPAQTPASPASVTPVSTANTFAQTVVNSNANSNNNVIPNLQLEIANMQTMINNMNQTNKQQMDSMVNETKIQIDAIVKMIQQLTISVVALDPKTSNINNINLSAGVKTENDLKQAPNNGSNLNYPTSTSIPASPTINVHSTNNVYNTPTQGNSPTLNGARDPIDSSLNYRSRSGQSAIDRRSENLLLPPKLPGDGIPTYDQFRNWWNTMKDRIEMNPVYASVLLDIGEGWNYFKSINPTYTHKELEAHYLQTHKSVWAYITSGLPESIKSTITGTLQNDRTVSHIPSILNFEVTRDQEFYKNCYQLVKLLSKQFIDTAKRRSHDILTQLQRMNFDSKEFSNPRQFYMKWKELQTALSSSSENPIIQSEDSQLIYIVDKLPHRYKSVADFYDGGSITSLESLFSMLSASYERNKINADKILQKTQHKNKEGNSKSETNEKPYERNNRSHKSREYNSHSSAAAASANISPGKPEKNLKNKKKSHRRTYSNNSQREGETSEGEQERKPKYAFTIIFDQKEENNTETDISPDIKSTMVSDINLDNDVDNDTVVNTSDSQADNFISMDRNNFSEQEVDTADIRDIIANPTSTYENVHEKDAVLDSAATDNCSGLIEHMYDVTNISKTTVRTVGTDKVCNQVGKMKLTNNIELTKVHYIKGSPFTLVSLPKLTVGQGFEVVFIGTTAYVVAKGTMDPPPKSKVIHTFHYKKGLYVNSEIFLTKEEKEQKEALEKQRPMQRIKKLEPKDLISKKDQVSSSAAREELNKFRRNRKVNFNSGNDSNNSSANNSRASSVDTPRPDTPSVSESKEGSNYTSSAENSSAASTPRSQSPASEPAPESPRYPTRMPRKQQPIAISKATNVKIRPSPANQAKASANNTASAASVQIESDYENDDHDYREFDDTAHEDYIPTVCIATANEVEPEDNSESENNNDSESEDIVNSPDEKSNDNSNARVNIWHNRLGHIGLDSLKHTNLAYQLGIPKDDLLNSFSCTCNTCMACKIKRTTVRSINANRRNKAMDIMDCWWVDLIGPFSGIEKGRRIKGPSFTGHNYVLVVVDEYSRFVMVQPLQRKAHAADELILLIQLMYTKTGKPLKRFHSDGGGEFINNHFKQFLREKGIELTFTTPNTPQLNGIAERMNQTLTTTVRCILEHSKAPMELWNLAYIHAAHIHNMTSNKAINHEIPSNRMNQGQQVMNMKHLRTWGCDVFAMIEEGKRGKLQSKALPGVFVGYNTQQNAYNILDVETLQVRINRNVIFKEYSFAGMNLVKTPVQKSMEHIVLPDDNKEWEVEHITNVRKINGITKYEVFWKGFRDPTWEPRKNLTNCEGLLKRFLARNKRAIVANAIIIAAVKSNSDLNYPLPQSRRQALKHVDSELWKIAEEKELMSLTEQNVFTPVELPKGRKALGCRWVYAVKRDSNNIIIQHKARLVVQGFRQEEGVDYFETFSPTVRIKSIKLLLSIAAQEDLEIAQLDYDTAFLNALLKEDIYVKIPEGYMEKVYNNTALRLNKALYGLKQAPREWWIELDQFLNKLGYKASELDECLYMKLVDNQRIYLTLYVDDTLAFYHKSVENIWLKDKAKIAAKYKIKDLGVCEWILHMAVKRDRTNKTIYLSQQAYMEKLLAKFQMDKANPTDSPFLTQDITAPPENQKIIPLTKEEHELYRSIVGSILYAANITRVDLAYIVNTLARYQVAPQNYHLAAARKILRYIAGTTKYQLVFKASDSGGTDISTDIRTNYNTVIYVDSSWGNSKDDRKGTGGHLVMINKCPITWQSKRHTTTPLSSTEAEFYALTTAVREALFLKQWFRVYKGLNITIDIKCDNQGAIHMSDHTTDHNRTKHIDIKYYFIREHIRKNKLSISYIRTTDQLADILTKAMPAPNFKRLSKLVLDQGLSN